MSSGDNLQSALGTQALSHLAQAIALLAQAGGLLPEGGGDRWPPAMKAATAMQYLDVEKTKFYELMKDSKVKTVEMGGTKYLKKDLDRIITTVSRRKPK